MFTFIIFTFSVPGEDSHMLLRQWESVLREETATPSESQGGGIAGGKEREGSGEGGAGRRRRGDCDGTTPEAQQDANSEPEAPNDSSAEEESGGEISMYICTCIMIILINNESIKH